ncbi:TPA: TrbC/VirB2 family protein [Pseudomonas aeruginosa]|uniref:TrbC/VirB2 family protein n=1 Tax=Pseudomonas aeruginosa group TaxID=136841 RepID=UPI00053F13BF|nr:MULTISPECIES: TrbC/VirB2 family protein [Pseudomonas aeruginosa group]EKW1630266.1 TrbC/VirB2 family protein [Pseudomonas aeruginosa]KSC39650.1 hypothetical protein AO882_24590 [Pseudomonas paraeruginosa]MCD2846558.1 TrbC/VirB2 family protein [Pseudomonas aeruginosa]MCG0483769.1 TrbC/VirB2 family protein [Pseudomonas aeruginosa]MCM8577018.1 TrbC/VirB2 family protein [Pseudomonas aeruginosa]
MDKLKLGSSGKKLGWMLMVLMFVFGSNLAMAAGVDTASSSLNSVETWLRVWIPIACVLGIMVMALLWWLHAIHATFIIRGVVAMILIGSASYIVSFFGLT